MKQPHVLKDNDGSMTMEWIYPDCRVGVYIDPSPTDSGWWAVTRDTQLCGDLPTGIDWSEFTFSS